MNSRHLIDRFAEASERGEDMVLVTVFETLGSTYSKAGARMLIMADGGAQGLVSGGCLEGDLAERARQVIASGLASTVTYDLRDEADELFGLGVGCNGLMKVLLQPLTAATGYEPMASIADALLGDHPGGIATVISSGSSDIDSGASMVAVKAGVRNFGSMGAINKRLEEACDLVSGSRLATLESWEEPACQVLLAPLIPIPRILILGAGLDARPLVNVLAELGWRVTVADHRPSYLRRGGFERAEQVCGVVPGSLADLPGLSLFAGIVVMSHHLATDREYLRELAAVSSPYLGLLGPRARRQRLLDDLGEAGESLSERLRGPVGIDIGADSAESIALSVAAEMQQVLAARDADAA